MEIQYFSFEITDLYSTKEILNLNKKGNSYEKNWGMYFSFISNHCIK